MGWFQRLSDGLGKTRDVVKQSLDRFIGRPPDAGLMEGLEEALLSADLGARVVERLIGQVNDQARSISGTTSDGLRQIFSHALYGVLKPVAGPSLEELVQRGAQPFVILVVGVNGVGKTTTIAKLAQRLMQAGRRPLLVAGDTFRAAAIDQLQVWADRVGAEVIRQRHGA